MRVRRASVELLGGQPRGEAGRERRRDWDGEDQPDRADQHGDHLLGDRLAVDLSANSVPAIPKTSRIGSEAPA
jgi:hypothetical protein